MKRSDYITKWASVFAIIALGWVLAPVLRTPLTSARIQTGERLRMSDGIGSASNEAVRRLPKLRTQLATHI